MKVEKIKQVKPDFGTVCGPTTTTTLGFKVGTRSFILGTFYEGPYMDTRHGEELLAVESIVDNLVHLSNSTLDVTSPKGIKPTSANSAQCVNNAG